jgi:uncharacterized protein (DUF1810 family)
VGLERFKAAQSSPEAGFEAALEEIRSGRKSGHWIWYVFPQLAGLGSSATARMYAVDGEREAADFLRDPELGSRLLTITTAISEQLESGVSLHDLMGSEIDALKLVSSLTLFRHVANAIGDPLATTADEVLKAALAEGYEPCAYTLRTLQQRDPQTE